MFSGWWNNVCPEVLWSQTTMRTGWWALDESHGSHCWPWQKQSLWRGAKIWWGQVEEYERENLTNFTVKHYGTELSCVQLSVAPWIVALHSPLSMAVPRQEYWTGLPFPTLGDLPTHISCISSIGRQILYQYCYMGNLSLFRVESTWWQLGGEGWSRGGSVKWGL